MILRGVTYSVCVLFITVISFRNVDSQICRRRTMVTIPKQISFTYTYKATYRSNNCWFGNCYKTRIQSRPAYKTITTREMRYIEECCEGFIRDDINTDNDTISCKPICMPSCINGYCKEPGICACYEGYVVEPTKFYNCLPMCSKACSHGTCVAPETCECDFGYTLNETCQPICSEPCENGHCSGPDICECLEGYRLSEKNHCEPYCFKGCTNGICIKPEVCRCDVGYTKVEEECVPECNECGNGACIAPNICRCDSGYVFQNETCKPVCNNSCDNGKCVAPNTCECNSGYTLENGTCQPFCSKECGMGRCSEPNTCQCYFGYDAIKDCDPYCCGPYCDTDCQNGTCTEDGTCECHDGYKRDNDDEKCIPDCKYDCGNGTCIEPDICRCYAGYEIDKTRIVNNNTNESLCVPICQNCGGTCIAPNICICYPPYETKNERADGEDCNCFSNCSDTAQQCHRTTCYLEQKSTTPLIERTHPSILIKIDWALTEGDSKTTSISLPNYSTTTIEYITTINYNTTMKPTRDNNIKFNHTNSKESNDKEQWSFLIWIYVVVPIVTILAIITIVIFIKRRSLSHYLKGGSYAIQDYPENIPESSQSIDIRFSRIDQGQSEL